MLRNKEIIVFTVIAAVTSAAASVLCFLISIAAGFICLLGCLSVFAACIVFTVRRYRKIAKLSSYLQKITHGEPVLDIRENTEGELSILKNEIYKAAVTLTEQADALHKDKLELSGALSDISHQLKTPLTSLGIMADLLENDNLPQEKRHEFIGSIRAGLDRMKWLVLTLLKLARLDADAAMLKCERVYLSALAEKALAPMLIPMEIKEQTYSVRGDDTEIICDPDWTTEALGNIVKNAVENTPDGGRVEISYGTNPLYNFITVRDNGSGIAKADMPHLFKRFYKGSSASRDSAGIGLAMSLAVMQRQSGDIEFSNDNGSVFTLKFYCDKIVTNTVTGQSH